MLRSSSMLLLPGLLLALTGTAAAHGGSWRGPVPLPPEIRVPTDPEFPRTPTARPEGPFTPGPGVIPAPSTPFAPPPRPRTPGGAAVPAATHWTRWWLLNRERILDLRALESSRIRERTAGGGPFSFGGGTRAEPDPAEGDDARRALVDSLLRAAGDGSADVASGAVVALGKAADPRVAPRLMEIAKDPRTDATVRESAVLSLGLLGPGDAGVRSFLVGVLDDPRERTRSRAFAALALGYLGDLAAMPALLARSRAKESSRDVPSCALLGLGLLGEGMLVEDLGEELSGRPDLREPDDVLRAYRAAALGMIRSPAAIPHLLRAVRDRDENVRRQAVLSLGAIPGPADGETVKTLLWALGSDKDPQVRAFAAVAVGETGDPLAADPLLYAFRKGDAALVPHAALGLALLARRSGDGTVRERIVPFLRAQFLERGSNDLRGALAVALGIAEDRAAAGPLEKLVGDGGDPELRAHAAIALGLIGNPDSAPVLRDALREKSSPSLQREAALALALIGDGEAAGILTDLVRDGSSEYVRGSAAVALGRLATPESAKALRLLLDDQRAPATTRAFVAVALGLVLDRRAVPALGRIGDRLNHRMATEAVAELLTFL